MAKRKRSTKAAASNGHAAAAATPAAPAATNGHTNGEGVRIGGQFYPPDQIPARYRRMTTPGGRSVDPSSGSSLVPPNMGRYVFPQVISFNSRTSFTYNVYRNPDEAVKHSLDNARFMRNDCSIMECLEARKRMTALLNWHLEPEDKKDARQVELVNDLTAVIEKTKNFTEYRYNLLDAIWYGRYANQHQYGFTHRNGKRLVIIKGWKPINGDKLAFRFDDGTGKFDDSEIGIRVAPAYATHDAIAGDRKIEYTEFGPAYFLEPWERSLVAVHKHMIEDGSYEDPMSAGRIHGVGVRDRIYWTWFQKQETMAQLMEVIERTGSGFTIYWYPDGNAAAKAEVEDVAAKQRHDNILVMPRMSGDPSLDAYGIDRVEPNTAGIEAMRSIVHEFFGHQIKRYILGQILSSESAATGLGSGVADLHFDSLMQIVQYDAIKLEETLTEDLVEPLKRFNFPEFADVSVRFKIDTESSESEKKLQAFKSAWEMGCRLKSSDVMDLIGASMPTEDDEVLFNPQVLQQVRLMQQQGMDGADAGMAGSGMPGIEQMFGPLAGLLGQGGGQGGPGGDMGGGGGDGDAGGPQPPGGPTASGPANAGNDRPTRFARWSEDDHPRNKIGELASKRGISLSKELHSEVKDRVEIMAEDSTDGQRDGGVYVSDSEAYYHHPGHYDDYREVVRRTTNPDKIAKIREAIISGHQSIGHSERGHEGGKGSIRRLKFSGSAIPAPEKKPESQKPTPPPATKTTGPTSPPLAPKRRSETSSSDSGRVDLRVPYANKDRAKSLGARWDAAKKVWYAPSQSVADKIRKARLEK